MRSDALIISGVRFSTLFGGGAKYSNGEDSLFIKELMDKGIQVYTSPEVIGRETESESTWFSGYHDKFFFEAFALMRQGMKQGRKEQGE